MNKAPYCGCSCDYCKSADEIDKHCYKCQDLAVGLGILMQQIKTFYHKTKGNTNAS